MAEDDELKRIKRDMMRLLMGAKDQGIWTDGEVAVLTPSNFDEALAKTSRPVLVDFWAS